MLPRESNALINLMAWEIRSWHTNSFAGMALPDNASGIIECTRVSGATCCEPNSVCLPAYAELYTWRAGPQAPGRGEAAGRQQTNTAGA